MRETVLSENKERQVDPDMSGPSKRSADPSSPTAHDPHEAPLTDSVLGLPDGLAFLHDNPAFNNAANQSVRHALLQRAQRTYGNHFVQRALAQSSRRTFQRQCACGGTCSRCAGTPLIPAVPVAGQSVQRNAPDVSRSGLREMHDLGPSGEGDSLPGKQRSLLESSYESDLSGVRIHTDSAAAGSAERLQADAYTVGRDIYFAAGKYAPASSDGFHLLAHEVAHSVQQQLGMTPTELAAQSADGLAIGSEHDSLEAHADKLATCATSGAVCPLTSVSDNAGSGTGRGRSIQRKIAADVLSVQLTPALASQMTDDELKSQIQFVRDHLTTLTPGSTEYMALQENLMVLEDQARNRTAQPSQAKPATSGGARTASLQVPRPAGLPLDQGYKLVPWNNLPADVVAAIPEGKLTSLPAHALTGTSSTTSAGGPRRFDPFVGGMPGAGSSLITNTNALLRMQGFAAAGENSIGLVGMPSYSFSRALTTGPLLPESTSILGHTAVTVRAGGQLTVRGLTPKTLELLKRYGATVEGQAGVPANVSSDAWLFEKPSSMEVNWAVPKDKAQQFLKELADLGEAPSNVKWTGVPSEYAKLGNTCTGTNCVLWATEQTNKGLGGDIAVMTPEGPVPLTSLGKGPGTASQGEFIKALKNVESGTAELAPIEGLAEPVVSGMPSNLKFLKVGGKVFMVVGVAFAAYEVYEAPEGEKLRTGVTAGAGFLGGLAAGAAAGLVCGPGAPVCSVILGLGFGIAGGMAANAAAGEVYDEVSGRKPATFLSTLPDIPCFPGNTRLLLPNGFTKPISEMTIGEQLLSVDLVDDRPPRFCVGTISKITKHAPKEFLRIQLENSVTLDVTANHYLRAGEEWKPAGELTVGDCLTCHDGNDCVRPSAIIAIVALPACLEVFDITVEGVHNYFAEGVLAHNKPL
jgi:hypothetical protein